MTTHQVTCRPPQGGDPWATHGHSTAGEVTATPLYQSTSTTQTR